MTFRRSTQDKSILISGILEMINTKVKSLVVIHRTSTQHFAIFYPFRYLPESGQIISTINLKSFQAKQISKDRIIIKSEKDMDGLILCLKIVNLQENSIERWLDAFTHKSTKLIKNKLNQFKYTNLATLVENLEE